ncbi:hypothetical protein GCM10007086_05130 [Photobacterium aphoticum]|uniref:Uncharacterized protein n=1 Tax=Photobacterium aphoticum TaxID=754436 RepID=A0A0J1GQI9_9GAMM|nr:hypothetical protein ABT58_06530 [Photobacterium aphoticum]PSU60280.1 hypothetical protein C9I90_01285 [Photobacterium aphoticum]GHA34587.1 hypothetical protein GCM10007086_05130 [Photobacterium aphoticum]
MWHKSHGLDEKSSDILILGDYLAVMLVDLHKRKNHPCRLMIDRGIFVLNSCGESSNIAVV